MSIRDLFLFWSRWLFCQRNGSVIIISMREMISLCRPFRPSVTLQYVGLL